MLVTFEGLDGTGKTTLINAVSKHFTDCLVTKEPGSPHVAGNKELRTLALEDKSLSPIERELVFYVDASKHRTWVDSNPVDSIILSDRGLWSHLAYLRGYLKTNQIDFFMYSACKNLIKFHTCATPDIIVYLRGDLKLMKTRTSNKTKDAIESQGNDFYMAVLDTYEDLVNNTSNIPVLVLDAKNTIDFNTQIVVNYLKEAEKVYDRKNQSIP